MICETLDYNMQKKKKKKKKNDFNIPTLQELSQQSKKISNDQELIQSDPTSCPINQEGNN